MATILDAGITYSLPGQPTADQLISLACDILSNRHRAGEQLSDPRSAKRLLQLRIGDSPREVFYALYLDTRHRLIHEEALFLGTIDGAEVAPREIVRTGLLCNAAAVILSHNHPSSVTDPSSADIAVTKRLKDALRLVDIRLLDHIIVGRTGATSFGERGLL